MSDVLLAFDDYVVGTAATYSSSFMDAALAELERYAIQAIVDPIPGTTCDNITVQLETSWDGRNWIAKNPTAEIAGSTPLTQTYVFSGSDFGTRPAGALVRLRVQLGGGTGATARVHIYVRETSGIGFTPAQLYRCRAWLRADLGLTIVGTNQIANWQDMTHNGYDAVQSSSSRQPTIGPATGLINGMPTVFFDPSTVGSEKIMTVAASLSGLSALHAFIVHRRTSTVPVNTVRAGFWRLGTSANSAHVPFTDGAIYDDTGSTTRLACGASIFNMANASCYEVQSTSSYWTNYINGTQQATTGTNTVSGPASPEFGGNSTVATYYDGYVAEIALVDRILDPAERNLIVAYFNSRYAIGMV